MKIVKVLPVGERQLCACGCGEKTSGRWDKRIKGYVRYIKNHHQKTERVREILRYKNKKINLGKKFSQSHKDKISENVSISRKKLFAEGKLTAWNKGIPRNLKDKLKISNSVMRLWKDKNYRKNWENGMKNKVIILPSSLEKRFIEIIKLYSLPFRYVGNGYTFIGGKCPDFIDFKQKKIIEINGDYWHRGDDPDERINHFAKYGYKTMIISSNDRKFRNEDHIIKKVIEFNNS